MSPIHESRSRTMSAYPEFVNRARGGPLDPARVPESLIAAIPFAELWGEIDDDIREDLLEVAPPDARRDLLLLIEQIDDELDDWLAGPEADEMPSAEYLAFSAMRIAADCI